MLDWSITNYGGKIEIDPYDSMPTGTICVCDIETDEKDNIVCIGICEDGVTVKVFFDIRPELIKYLQQVQLVCHGGKGAEIPWLSKYGVTIQQLYFDTMIGMYVYDSTRKSYGLKKILEDLFKVKYPTYKELTSDKELIKSIVGDVKKLPKSLTLDKLPKDLVAEYNAADCFYTFKLYTWLRQNMSVAQKNFLETIELPMTKLIYHMEQKGVKIDTKKVREIHNAESKNRRRAKKSLFKITGTEFNLNSPKQLLPILQSNGLKVTSTGEEAIQPYGHLPLVQALLDYRRTNKVCTTYTIPLYANAIKDAKERIHSRFNQNTITGRLSSSNPINLQNQPKIVRECFVATDNHQLIGSDWTNVELYLPANFSKEPGFIEELSKPDGDLHVRTAKFLFGVDISSLSEDEYSTKRQKAKTCNFLLTNSGSAKRLSIELNCSQKEAEEYYTKFWEGYSVLAGWLKEEKKKAWLKGGVTTMYGRWVPLPSIKSWCGVANCPVYDKETGFYCKACAIREATEREAISIIVQGSAAELMKLSALRLYKEYGLVPIISCHDELLYEIEEDKVEDTRKQINYVMENIHSFQVPLKANVSVGHSWKEAH